MECTYARTPALEHAYAEVSAKAFKRPTEMRDHKLLWFKRPHYEPEHTRIVIDEGKVVAGVAIVELPVNFGGTVLRLGGVSCVATDPDAWKRGYGRACMQDSVAYMARDGFDISFLLGIRDYYWRFGFRTALVWFACRFEARDVQVEMPAGLRVRKVRRSDIPAMDALYRQEIARHDLSVARTGEDWNWYFRFHKMDHAYALVDAKGQLLAYATANPRGGSLRVDEVATAGTTEAFDGTIALLRERARESFATSVEMYTPPEGPFARYCLCRKRMEWRSWTDYVGGPMLRLFNVEPLFGKLAPAMSARWQNAPRSTPPEAVTIRCPMGQVAFVPRDGSLAVCPGDVAGQVVEVPDEALTELVMGFRPADDILADADVRATDAARRVVAVLFPLGRPFMSPIDHM